MTKSIKLLVSGATVLTSIFCFDNPNVGNNRPYIIIVKRMDGAVHHHDNHFCGFVKMISVNVRHGSGLSP